MRVDVETGRATGNSVRVWDLGVRAFHWLLVAAVTGAAVTGFLGSRLDLVIHLVSGTLIAALVTLRLIWGLLGPTYARFANFLRSPRAVLAYAAALWRGDAPRFVGHNPLGGISIILLLTALASLVVTGLVVLGGTEKDGPLAAVTSFATGREVREIHEAIAIGLLVLIGLHVAGVLHEIWRSRDNLVKAMLTGRKAMHRQAIDAPPVTGRPAFAALIGAALIAIAALAVARLSAHQALGVPAAPLDPTYARECGECHTAHHPSLAPAATWSAVMAGLAEHFGNNASLDPPVVTALAAYLAANSAEHWDSPAANLLRQPSPTEPLRISATRGWQRLHRGVAPAQFAADGVKGRVNCGGCHRDAASGRFLYRAIELPPVGAAKPEGKS